MQHIPARFVTREGDGGANDVATALPMRPTASFGAVARARLLLAVLLAAGVAATACESHREPQLLFGYQPFRTSAAFRGAPPCGYTHFDSLPVDSLRILPSPSDRLARDRWMECHGWTMNPGALDE